MNRSFHFVPAHRADYYAKAFASPADAVVLDLEDGVPSSMRDAGRELAIKWLSERPRGRWFLRLNASRTPDFKEDLAVLAEAPVEGVILPKIGGPEEVSEAAAAIRSAREVRIIGLAEDFAAVQGLPALLENVPLFGVGIGLEDLSTTIIHAADEVQPLLDHLRLATVLAARANGAISLDSVSLTFRDETRLMEECRTSRSLGFDGMFSIHPAQIETINDVFGPSPAAVKWARSILSLRPHDLEGGGYVEVDGMLLSLPKVKKACSIINSVGENMDD